MKERCTVVVRSASIIENFGKKKLKQNTKCSGLGACGGCFQDLEKCEIESAPFTMRSDSELLIFFFDLEKRWGLLMESDFAKSDGLKSYLRILWP